MIACLLLLALGGCRKKDGPTGPQGAAGVQGTAGYRGVIAGRVLLYDTQGGRILQGFDSIQVSLNDSITTAADKNGYYIFTDVPTGTYTIKVSDPGYGSTQSGNFAFIKDTLFKELRMTKKPGAVIKQLMVIRRKGSPDFASVNQHTSGEFGNVILFVGKSPQVSGSNYLLYYISHAPAYSQITIPEGDFSAAGIFYGDTVYYAAYSYVSVDHSSYIDDKTGLRVFTALGSMAMDTLAAK